MNDVVTGFHDALVALSDAGEALAAFNARIHLDPDDLIVNETTQFPMLIIRPGRAVPADVARGSRIAVSNGTIILHAWERLTPETSGAHGDGREAIEVHRANIERALFGMRELVTAGQPLGCWSRMTYSEIGDGPDASGLWDIAGLRCYRYSAACVFRFARTRAA